ncbi:MAG TPA: ABC transporter substrate-binding protein [Acidimicrobiales bacterium]
MKFLRLLAVAAVVGLLLSACGSSSKSGGNAAATTLPSGTPIVIGQLSDETGVAGATGAVTDARDTMNAWVKWTNAHGGISGHPVQVKTIDTKSDPAQANVAVKQLVEQDHVVALVGNSNQNLATFSAYLKAQKVPYIGGPIYSLDPITNPMVYSATTTVISNVWGEIYAADQKGIKTLASLLCSNSTVCQGARPLVISASKDLGIQVVFDGVADSTASSYTPQCLAMKQSGAEAVLPFVNNQLLANDCARQGYKPTYVTSNTAITLDQIKATPAFEGTVGPLPVFPWFQEYPATKAFFDGMKQYAPQYVAGGSKYNTENITTSDTWVSGEIFKKAVENAAVAAGTAVTTPDVIKGLSMFKDETLGGMSPPLTYGDGTTTSPQIKCFYLYSIKGGKNVMTGSQTELQTSCQP